MSKQVDDLVSISRGEYCGKCEFYNKKNECYQKYYETACEEYKEAKR